MPARMTAFPGIPTWVDLQTSDPGKVADFYTSLFGWTAGEPSAEFGGYFMFMLDGVPVAGCMASDPQAPVRDVWSTYLATDDAQATHDAVVAAGGQVVVPPMPVADLGTMGFVVDSDGAGVGYWQPGSFHGFGRIAEPGAPAWFELHSHDFAKATAFYRDAFGFTTQVLGDTDEFRYHVALDPDGNQCAGLMDGGFTHPGDPSQWLVYFAVADTDASVARALELGGGTTHEAHDSPYGRLGYLTDPFGAAFMVIQANA